VAVSMAETVSEDPFSTKPVAPSREILLSGKVVR
jgi:hypothetical protein